MLEERDQRDNSAARDLGTGFIPPHASVPFVLWFLLFPYKARSCSPGNYAATKLDASSPKPHAGHCRVLGRFLQRGSPPPPPWRPGTRRCQSSVSLFPKQALPFDFLSLGFISNFVIGDSNFEPPPATGLAPPVLPSPTAARFRPPAPPSPPSERPLSA